MATAAAAAAEIAETLSSVESVILTERIANEFIVEEFKKSIVVGDLEQHLEEHGNRHADESIEVDARTSEGESFFQSSSLAEVGIEKTSSVSENATEEIPQEAGGEVLRHEIQLQKDVQSEEAVEKIEYEAETLKDHDEEKSFPEDVPETVSNIENIEATNLEITKEEHVQGNEEEVLVQLPDKGVRLTGDVDIESTENVSTLDVIEDAGKGPSEIREDVKPNEAENEATPELENPEIVATEISSVTKEGEVKMMASEEVKDSVLERTNILDEDSEGKGTKDPEEQSGDSTFTGGVPAGTFVEQIEEETLLEDSKKVDLQELHIGESTAVIEEERATVSHQDGGEEQNLPLIQDEEQVKSQAVEMEDEERTEVTSFEPEEHIAEEHKEPVLEEIKNEDNVNASKITEDITTAVHTLSEENLPLAQEEGINVVSEDNEALKEHGAIIEDKIEASREIAIAELPTIEENLPSAQEETPREVLGTKPSEQVSEEGRQGEEEVSDSSEKITESNPSIEKGLPLIQEAEQLMVEVEDAKPEKSNEEDEILEVKETQCKNDLEADKSSEVVLAEHASAEKGYEANQTSDGDRDIADTKVEETSALLDVEVDVSGGEQGGFVKDDWEEPEEEQKEFGTDVSSAKMEDYRLIEEVTKDTSGKLSSSAEVQTSNGDILSIQQVEETNTSYTEKIEVNSSVEFEEISASNGAAEVTNPPVPLEALTLPELEVKAPSDESEMREAAEEAVEDPLDIKVEVNGNTYAEDEEAKSGIQEKESETTEAVSSEIEVPDIHIKSEYADEHKIQEPEKQPESTDAANDSICEDISNEGVNDEQRSAETSEEVKEQVIEEVGDVEEIHELAAEKGIIIEERDADLALVDSTEATDAVKEAEFISLETKEIPTSGGESCTAEIERSKMQRQDSASIPVTEDAREETKEVILEATPSCDKIDGENVLALGEAQQNQQPENTESDTVSTKTTEVDVEGEDLGAGEDLDAEAVEVEGEQPITEQEDEKKDVWTTEDTNDHEKEGTRAGTAHAPVSEHLNIETPVLSEITRESEAASEETPISDTQYEEPVSSGEITSSQNFPSVKLENQIHTTEPSLATELIEDPIAIVENITEKDVELSSAPGIKEVCLEKEEPQKPVDGEANEGTQDIPYEVREEKKTEDEAAYLESPIQECKTYEYISEENELIQNAITTQEGQAGSEQASDAERENVGEVDELVQDGIPSEQETDCGIVSGEDNEAAEEDENTKGNVDIIVQEKDASVLPKEELQEETATIIQKIVEESDKDTEAREEKCSEESMRTKEVPEFGIEPKECLEEPSDIEGEVNSHTHTENEAVKTGTQEKASETIEVSSETEVPEIHIKSEDADRHKIEEPEAQPETVDEYITVEPEKQPESKYAANDSISVSDERATDEQGTKISEEIKEQVIEEVGNVKEIDERTPEEGTIIEERDVDLALVDSAEQEDEKKDVLPIEDLHDHEKEGSIEYTAPAPESEHLEIQKEMRICDNQYEEPVSSGETTSDQNFPSVKLEDQINITESTLHEEQNEDPTTIVENIIEKDVTVEIEEIENLELSSAAGTEEVCLEKEELKKPVDCEANEGTQDRAYEVREENKTEDEAVSLEPPVQECEYNTEENELIHNVITTQEGKDGSGQVHDTEKGNVDEVNELIHDGIPNNQKLDEYEKVDESESLKLEDGDAKEIHEPSTQHVTASEERSCAIVAGEDNEESKEDETRKGNVEGGETIIVQEKDATEHVEEIMEMKEEADIPNDKSNAETVVGVATEVKSSEAQQEDDNREEGITSSCIAETVEVIKEVTSENEMKENVTESEGSDIRILNLESMSIEAEEQQEIVTETNKFVKDEISTEEGQDGDREIEDSDTKLEGGEAKPIFETPVEQLTANKEGETGPVSGEFPEAADSNDQRRSDAASVEAASESESCTIKQQETVVTQDEQITSSIEKVEANELVKELISEEVNTISEDNSDIKTADGVAAVIHSSEAYPDNESTETRISTQEATQETETLESIAEEGSETNLKEVIDEAEKQREIVTEAYEPLQDAVSNEEVDNGHEEVVESESIKLESGSADETCKISSRDITSEEKCELNVAADADELTKASESSNIELPEVIELKEEEITCSIVQAEGTEEHFKEHIIREDTIETRELKFEATAETEPKDAISASENSEIKSSNVEEISVAEVRTYEAAVANELVKEGTDEAASESESYTVKLHEEEEFQEEKDTIEHVKKEIVKEADDKSSDGLVTSIPTEIESPEVHVDDDSTETEIASGVTFETREIIREVEQEAEKKEPSSESQNLEEVTTVDVKQSENVIEANDKEISFEEEKGPVSGEYKEAEDTSECISEGDYANQSESSTVKLHEETEFQEENDTSSALQAKDAAEHVKEETAKEADDKSSDELLTSIAAEIESPEAQEDNDSRETGIASSVTYENREITSEVKLEVENLNLMEATTVDVNQFENVTEAYEKGISSEEGKGAVSGEYKEAEDSSVCIIEEKEEEITCSAVQSEEHLKEHIIKDDTIETRELKFEAMAVIEPKETISGSDIKNSNLEEISVADDSKCENVAVASEIVKEGTPIEEVHTVQGNVDESGSAKLESDEANLTYETSSQHLAVSGEKDPVSGQYKEAEDTTECIREGYDEIIEAATTSESSIEKLHEEAEFQDEKDTSSIVQTKDAQEHVKEEHVKESDDKSRDELVTSIARKIESPEASVDNDSTETGIASGVALETREIITEVEPESVDSEIKNRDLEEVTAVDVKQSENIIKANEKEISSEEEKGPVSGEYNEAEETSECRREYDEPKEAASQSESSTVKLHEEAEFQEENDTSSALQAKDAKEHVKGETAKEAADDNSSDELVTPIVAEIESAEPQEDNDSTETGIASSVTFETREITSEVKPEVEKKESVDSEVKNLNLVEAATVDVKQFENAIEAIEKEISSEEVNAGQVVEDESESMKLEGTGENVTTVVTEINQCEAQQETETKEVVLESDASELTNLNSSEIQVELEKQCENVTQENEATEGGKFTEEAKEDGSEAVKQSIEEVVDVEKENYETSHGNLLITEERESSTALAEHSEATNESESSTKEVLEIEKVQEEQNLVSTVQGEDTESAEANLSKAQEDDLPVQALELDSEKESQEPEDTKSSFKCEIENVELGETSPNLVEQPEDEGFKVVSEQIYESKDLRVEVVDEAEAKLENESDKVSADPPSDAVISYGASQFVLEESEITHEAKSEIRSREILTGAEDVESETEPTAENVDGHPKESHNEIEVGTNYGIVDEEVEDDHGITDMGLNIEEQLVDRSCTTEEIQAVYEERESTFVAAQYIEAKDQDEQTQGGKIEDKEKDVIVSTDETEALTEEVENAVEEYNIGLEKRSLETIVIDSIQSDGKSQIIDGEASDSVDQLSRGAEELVETETSFDAVDVSPDHVTAIAAMKPEVQDASIDTKESKGTLEEAAVSHQSSSDTKLEMEEGIPILQPEEQKHETPSITEQIEEERSKEEEIQANGGLGLTSTLEATEEICSVKHLENLESSTFGKEEIIRREISGPVVEEMTKEIHQEHKQKNEEVIEEMNEKFKGTTEELQKEDMPKDIVEAKVENQKAETENIMAETTTLKKEEIEKFQKGDEELIEGKQEILQPETISTGTMNAETANVPSKDNASSLSEETVYRTPQAQAATNLEPGNTQEMTQKSISGEKMCEQVAETDKADFSLTGLINKARDEKSKVGMNLSEERDMVGSTLELHTEEAEAKKDEEKDEAEEDEHRKAETELDAPVMVENAKDIDVKTPKKHSNILSGVSSKVKHSISKVKKAIIGKPSNSKTKASKTNEALSAS